MVIETTSLDTLLRTVSVKAGKQKARTEQWGLHFMQWQKKRMKEKPWTLENWGSGVKGSKREKHFFFLRSGDGGCDKAAELRDMWVESGLVLQTTKDMTVSRWKQCWDLAGSVLLAKLQDTERGQAAGAKEIAPRMGKCLQS